MKKFVIVLLTVSTFFFGGLCQAAKEYDKEINLPLGILFSIGMDNVGLQILRGEAQIVNVKGVEHMRATQLGDVLLKTRFTVPGVPQQYHNYTYLIHVVAPENLQAADNFLAQKETAELSAIDVSKFPQQVLTLVNKERAKVGAAPLRLSAELQEGAAIRAREIAQVFSHTRPNGKKCQTVIRNGWDIGENIAAGNSTPEEVVEGWMNSPGHRANILDRRYGELGVGYCYDVNGVGGYKHYWVQMFRLK